MVGMVTEMSRAKRRYVSITYTASRAADSATMARGPRVAYPGTGKRLTTFELLGKVFARRATRAVECRCAFGGPALAAGVDFILAAQNSNTFNVLLR